MSLEAVHDRSISVSPAAVAVTLVGTLGPDGGGGGGGGGVVGHSEFDAVLVGPASSVPVGVAHRHLDVPELGGDAVGIVFFSVAPLVAVVYGLPVPSVP